MFRLRAVLAIIMLFPYSDTSAGEALTGVRARLEDIRRTDQVYRLQLDSLVRKAHLDWRSREVQHILPLMAYQDSLNLEYVKGVLRRYGWLSIAQVDSAANEAIFLVIQHADSLTMRAAFPLLVQSYETFGSPAEYYAMMLDRLLAESGKEQVYGTQIRPADSNGHFEPFPVADPAMVDVRRRRLGLPPLNEYLEQWNGAAR